MPSDVQCSIAAAEMRLRASTILGLVQVIMIDESNTPAPLHVGRASPALRTAASGLLAPQPPPLGPSTADRLVDAALDAVSDVDRWHCAPGVSVYSFGTSSTCIPLDLGVAHPVILHVHAPHLRHGERVRGDANVSARGQRTLASKTITSGGRGRGWETGRVGRNSATTATIMVSVPALISTVNITTDRSRRGRWTTV